MRVPGALGPPPQDQYDRPGGEKHQRQSQGRVRPRSTQFVHTLTSGRLAGPLVVPAGAVSTLLGLAGPRPITPGRRIVASSVILPGDRKSTRLNSSHVAISYAVFCFNI